MKGKLIKKFAAVCALGAGMSLLPAMIAPDEGELPLPAPAPLAEETETPVAPLPVFCEGSTIVQRDEKLRPWIRVESMTRDGVAVALDLNVSYRIGGAIVTAMTNCDDIGRHIMGLAKIAYAQKILEQDYTELPQAAPLIPRSFAIEMNKQLSALMGPAAAEIVGVGINNVSAPGMTRAQATAMMTQGLALPPYKAPRLLAQSHDNHTVEFSFEFNYQAAPRAYEYFGPYRDAIKAHVTQILHHQLANVAAQWQASCLAEGRGLIESEVYSGAAEELAAQIPGLFLLEFKLGDVKFPEDVSLPPVENRTAPGLCRAP